MSWNTIEKSKTGIIQYTLASYSTSITNSHSSNFKVTGYSNGTVSFTNNGDMTAYVYGTMDNVEYFITASKNNPTQSGDKLSWSIPVKGIKVSCSGNNTIDNIDILIES